MASGKFQYARYAANAGGIYRIRVQPETLQLNIGSANSSAGGTINQAGTVRASGSKRQFGVIARRFSIKFQGTPPDGYAEGGIIQLPILTPAVYNAANLGDTGTYLGATVELVGKTPESVR